MPDPDAAGTRPPDRLRDTAHELGNRLASIIAFSQLIRTDPRLPDDLHHQADLVVEEADRIRRIVEQLLDEARAASAATHVEPDAAPRTSGPEGAAAPAVRPGSPPSDGDRPRVLVLDDEAPIRELLGRMLGRLGYEPILAADGPAALAAIDAAPPDAVLCDHRIAGQSGTAFYDAAVAAAPGLARRFAFMSGDVTNPELRAFARPRGIVLVAKPFDAAAVDATIATLLAEPA